MKKKKHKERKGLVLRPSQSGFGGFCDAKANQKDLGFCDAKANQKDLGFCYAKANQKDLGSAQVSRGLGVGRGGAPPAPPALGGPQVVTFYVI